MAMGSLEMMRTGEKPEFSALKSSLEAQTCKWSEREDFSNKGSEWGPIFE